MVNPALPARVMEDGPSTVVAFRFVPLGGGGVQCNGLAVRRDS